MFNQFKKKLSCMESNIHKKKHAHDDFIGEIV